MNGFHLPDARGWIGLSVFVLTCGIIAMLATIPELRGDEFFKTIAALIVGAYIKDVVGWAYTATKAGGELAQQNADIVRKQTEQAPTGNAGDPLHVTPEPRQPVPGVYDQGQTR